MSINDFDFDLESDIGTTKEEPIVLEAELVQEDFEANGTSITDADNSEPSKLAAELRKSLTDAEVEKVTALVPKINLEDPSVITNYAFNCQSKLNSFSDDILKQAQLKDLGTVGDALLSLVAGLNDFTPSKERIPQPTDWGFKNKIRRYIARLRGRYSSVKANVDAAEKELRNHLIVLTADQKTLVKLEELMFQYLRLLSMYIVAGYDRLESVKANELAELRMQANANPNSEISMRYEALQSACDRFDRKLMDLALSRAVTVQNIAQSRILQENDRVLGDKIISTINNAIPLWKNQMVISLGIANSLSALEAQERATEMTNFLLRENSKNLKQGTVRLAKANERGIVEIETLVQTNQDLISTITEVQQIHAEGRAKRKACELELVSLEKTLKEHLIKK